MEDNIVVEATDYVKSAEENNSNASFVEKLWGAPDGWLPPAPKEGWKADKPGARIPQKGSH